MSASREKRLRRELREAEVNPDIVSKEKKKKKKTYMSQAKAKKIRSAIGSAAAILLVVFFALLIFVNSGYMQTHATALTVGNHKLTPVDFNYYYQDTYYNLYSSYNSYGMWDYVVDTTQDITDQECLLSEDGGTWADYITETAAASAMQIYALYDAAMEEGFTLDEETQASVDSTPDNLAIYAEAYGYDDTDEYLEDSYGKGATVESYMNYVEVQQIASAYSTAKGESFEYTDDVLQAYYDEHSQDYDKVSYRVFTVTTEDDDTDAAKSTADAMAAELDSTEESFIKAALSYAPEDSKESYEDEDYTLRKYTYANTSTDYADWLFSTERLPGESQVFATSTGYAVVMFVERDENDYKTVDVRHILVQVEATGDDGESTEDDWTVCKEAIDEIEALWIDSEMSEDAFAQLANEYSEDTGSNTTGGLYEDIYKGTMVAEFEDWCFDETRQIGDTGIVKTDYGYHLMYFSGTGEEYFKTLADSSKRSEDYNAWYEEYSADYEAKTKTVGQWFCNKELPTLASTSSYSY